MAKFLLWLLLLIVAWPLALLVLVLYPLFWLIALPWRLVVMAVKGIFGLLGTVLRAPGRLLGGSD
ncbi:MAG: hypothetical protein ACR2MA_06755 [Egibacteraceae bacterium]